MPSYPIPAPIQAEVARPPAVRPLDPVVWSGLAGRYRDIVGPCTEAPESFHLGSFIAAVGCLLGRKVWFRTPHKTYANVYCLLVGKTGHTKKTTAYRFALRLLSEAGELLGAKVKDLHGLSSVEGLAEAMRDKDSDEPFSILCVEDEFRSLAAKGAQKAVSNVIPKLTELYNAPPKFEVNTRKDPIRVKNPYLCLLSATTRAWFEASLSSRDVSGGFLNRWLVFEGAVERILPHPPLLDEDSWLAVVTEIADAIEKASGELGFDSGARDLYTDFYGRAHEQYVTEATSRVTVHAYQLAMIFAVLARHRAISKDDLKSGIAVAEYCANVVDPLAAGLDVSPHKRLEDRILALLAQHPVGSREGYRTLHVSASEFGRAMTALVAVKQIEYDNGLYRLVR